MNKMQAFIILCSLASIIFGMITLISHSSGFGAQCTKAGVKPSHYPECVRLLSNGESIIHLDFDGKEVE